MSEVESAKYWISWIETGNTIALLLVALGVGFEFVANRLERPLRERIEHARELEIEQLRKDSAEANLEIARLKQPRTLTREQCQKLTGEMKAYSGQWFSMSAVSDPEAMDLVRTIGDCLTAASWEKQAPQSDVASGDVGISIGRGVRIQVVPGSSPRTESIARALVASLQAKGLETVFEVQPQLRAIEVINVMAGTKPLR